MDPFQSSILPPRALFLERPCTRPPYGSNLQSFQDCTVSASLSLQESLVRLIPTLVLETQVRKFSLEELHFSKTALFSQPMYFKRLVFGYITCLKKELSTDRYILVGECKNELTLREEFKIIPWVNVYFL